MPHTIGIELGSTNCRVAWLHDREGPQIALNCENERFTPTAVARHPNGEFLVGRAALRLLASNPASVSRDVVRHLATGTPIQLNGDPVPAIELGALLLRRLKSDAEARLGDTVPHAHVAIPPTWSKDARERLREAGDQAGLIVDPIESSIAAFLASRFCGREQHAAKAPDRAHWILVYDLGGTDFHVTLLRLQADNLSIQRTASLSGLAGSKFDQQIIDSVAVLVHQQYGIDPTGNHRFIWELRRQAEQVKIQLGQHQNAEIVMIGALRDKAGQVVDVEHVIEREDFERLIEEQVQSTIQLTRSVLQQVDIGHELVDSVLMIGGSSQIPVVRQALHSLFGSDQIVRDLDPLECAALGTVRLAAPFGLKIQPLNFDNAGLAVAPPLTKFVLATESDQSVGDGKLPTVSTNEPGEGHGQSPSVPAPYGSLPPQNVEGPPSIPNLPNLSSATGPIVEVPLSSSEAGIGEAPKRPTIELASQEIACVHYHREFSERAFVAVATPAFHLATPLLSESPMDRVRLYLSEPMQSSLEFDLLIRRAGENLRARITVPIADSMSPAVPIDVVLYVDDAGIPFLTISWQPEGQAEPVLLHCQDWVLSGQESLVVEAGQSTSDSAALSPRTMAAPDSDDPEFSARLAFGQKPLYGRYTPSKLQESSRYCKTFLSQDPETSTPVLLHVFLEDDERARGAFLSSLIAIDVSHPNVIRVQDFGKSAEGFYLVTEFVGGGSLRDLMSGGAERAPAAPEQVLPFIVQTLKGLEAIHRHNICHRNLKPSNILLDCDARVAKISDFQISLALRAGEFASQVAGTLPYMAPEILGGRADKRADIYSVGVILYELLTGRLPFWSTSQRQLVDQILKGNPPEPRSLKVDIPEHLNDMILRALETDVERRFQTAEEFGDALVQEPDSVLHTIISRPDIKKTWIEN